jgi:ectoine hydroxylase-related dioxygenase (phytanoyl-CoA dioxygenase family)
MGNELPRYGVHKQSRGDTAIDVAVESVQLIGYAVVEGGYTAADMARLTVAFDDALKANLEHYGIEDLRRIDEHNTVRALLGADRAFLELVLNRTVLARCRRLMGDYIILNQQNGIVNPPNGQRYNQDAYHRDLPYQHFVSSHPLMVNALFCLDPFTAQNGATYVVPASHKVEAFPSDATTRVHQRQIVVPAGSFIVMDSMVFHRGGLNTTDQPRRAINQAYSIPYIRPQIDLPAMLGDGYTSDPDSRRLLGYGLRTPQDVAAYYAARTVKASGH